MKRLVEVFVLTLVLLDCAGAQERRQLQSRAAFAGMNAQALSDSAPMRPLNRSDRFESLMLDMMSFVDQQYGGTYNTTGTRIRRWDGFSTHAHPVEGILVDGVEVRRLLDTVIVLKGGARIPPQEINRRVAYTVEFLVAHEYAHMIQYRVMARDSLEDPNNTRTIECSADILGGALFRKYVGRRRDLDSAQVEAALITVVDFGWVLGSPDWLDGTTHPLPENRRNCIREGQKAAAAEQQIDLVDYAMKRGVAVAGAGAVVGGSMDYAVTRDSTVSEFVTRVATIATSGVAAMLDHLQGPASPGADTNTFMSSRALPDPWRCELLRTAEGAIARCMTESPGARALYDKVVASVKSALETPRWKQAQEEMAPDGPSRRIRAQRFMFDDATFVEVSLEAAEVLAARQMLPLQNVILSIGAARQQEDTAAARAARRDRADSIAIVAALGQLEADSLEEHQRKRDSALSILRAPIVFAPGSDVLSAEAQDLLKAKAWLMYVNEPLRLTIVGRVDPATRGSRAVIRSRIGVVRKFLERRAIDLTRIDVSEVDAPAPPQAVDTLLFVAGLNENSVVDVPPTSADPPRVNTSLFGLTNKNRRYGWGTVRVFYATDRVRAAAQRPNDFYSGDRTKAGGLEFGSIEVTVPRVHREGVIEQPHWYTLERVSNDTSRYMFVRSVKPESQAAIMDSLRRVVAGSGRKEAFVFIHGYNVSFNDAALRTAQITYDLGFDGAPILYSWSSKGNILRYNADIEAADFTVIHLAAFLDSVVSVTGAKRVHVIAHSMGNRALTFALERMARPGRDTILANVVMAAADVDAVRFEQQLAMQIRPLMQRMTIYMSGRDKALWASRVLSTNKRLGESTSPILIIPTAETIDASSIPLDLLGHGYIGQSVAVLDDLKDIIMGGLAPPRSRLRPVIAPDGTAYWRIP